MASPAGSSPGMGSYTGTGGSTMDSRMGAAVHQGSEAMRHAVDRASASAHETVDRVASTASRFAERIDERTRRMTDAPLRLWHNSRTSVQDHPMQAIAASLVIGFLIGRLTGSRSRFYDY